MQRIVHKLKKWKSPEFIFIAIVERCFILSMTGADRIRRWALSRRSVRYMGTFKAALYAGTFIYTDPGGSDWQRLSVSIDAKKQKPS